MTDKELIELVASLAIESKKTDEQIKQTDEKLKSIGVQLRSMSKNQGDVAEEFFINSISPTLKVGGIQYDELNSNMYKQTRKAQGEFDIVLVNGKKLLIIETKYKAHKNDLDYLINKTHKNFRTLYPQYNDYAQHLAIASFYISNDTKKEALEQNVMVLQRKDELIETFLP